MKFDALTEWHIRQAAKESAAEQKRPRIESKIDPRPIDLLQNPYAIKWLVQLC